MRELYIQIITRYIESTQMRDYLVSVVDKLQPWQIIDLICGARAGIKDKIESLLELSEFETDDEKKDEKSAYNAAKTGKRFLEELVLKQGEVLLNMEYGYDDEKAEEKIWGAAPHFSVKSVMKYVNEEYEELDEQEKKDAIYWYRLEKYAPQNDFELDWRYYYTVAPNGAIWFARDVEKDEGQLFDDSQDLNLPVPFEIGDIITIDCRPFAPVKQGVIIEKGDNWGCCRPAGSALNEIVVQGVSSEDKFIRFYSAPSYPYRWSDDEEFMNSLSSFEYSEYLTGNYDERTAELQKCFEGYDLMYDQIFGNANYIQFVAPESRCVSLYRTLYGVDTTEDEWIVLLQYLYNPHRVHFIFCIHKNDLKKGRFDRVFAITEFD